MKLELARVQAGPSRLGRWVILDPGSTTLVPHRSIIHHVPSLAVFFQGALQSIQSDPFQKDKPDP